MHLLSPGVLFNLFSTMLLLPEQGANLGVAQAADTTRRAVSEFSHTSAMTVAQEILFLFKGQGLSKRRCIGSSELLCRQRPKTKQNPQKIWMYKCRQLNKTIWRKLFEAQNMNCSFHWKFLVKQQPDWPEQRACSEN